MYRYEDQKEMRMAMNGKMIVMLAGVFLILTAVTSTLLQGIQYFIVGHSAGAGDAEAIKLVESTGLSIGQLYSVGAAYMIVTVAEIMTGIISAKFSNRLDKVKICLYADIVLMVVMILQQSYMMLLARMFNPFALVAGILMPLLLLWGITRLMKLAKKYPDRMYAVEPNPARGGRKAAPQKQNIMEKAKARVRDEEKVAQVVDELPDANEEE
ncbi:putative uncharacterized protein [Firmicutes bacterium CAG:646]|nr:putative uncharacterized protein [Firmicutes bacterium CAG:646]